MLSYGKKRKVWLAMAAVLLLMLSVVGCSGSSAKDGADNGSGANSSGSPDDKSVTLKMILWTNAPTVNVVKEINEKFHEKYPNIMVEAVDTVSNDYPQVQQTRIAAKDVDIVANQAFVGAATDWAPKVTKPAWQQWIDAGSFEPLDGQPFLDRFTPDALRDASTYNGKVYGLETGSVAYNGMFYNIDTFEKLGLTPPKTWDEMVHILDTLKENKMTPLVMGGKDGWPQNLPSQGIFSSVYPDAREQVQKLWTGEAKFTDPDYKKIYERVEKLWSYALPNYLGLGYDEAMSYFASGKAALLPDGTWRAPDIAKANPDLKYGYFAIPGDTSGSNNYLAGKYDLQWMVMASSKNKDAAMKWLDFFSQPDIYKQYVQATGFLPTQPNINLEAATQATKDILELSKNFRLALDQVNVVRKGIEENSPGSVFDFANLKPQGKMDANALTEQAQKAFDSTASMNK